MKQERLAMAKSQSFSAEVIRVHPIAAFDPYDLEIRVKSKDGWEKTLLEIEGVDSAGLQFLNDFILLSTDVGLPTDQPGYMNVVAICGPNASTSWEIRRGLPFIEKDTIPTSTVFDSVWTIRTYKSVRELKRQYVFATMKGREDFPQIYSFLGSDNVKSKFLDSGIVEVLVNWPTKQFEMSFSLSCQPNSWRTVLTINE